MADAAGVAPTSEVDDVLGASCVSLTWTVGDENSKLLALRYSQPSFSPTITVATSGVPELFMTETVAFTGALEKL